MTARGLSDYREAWAAWLTKVFTEDSDVRVRMTPSETWLEKSSLVTLTFAPRPWELSGQPGVSRVTRAGRRFERSLTRALARPSWFGVLERGKLNGRMHLHWLIFCRDDVPMYEAMQLHRMKEGYADVVTSRRTTPVEYVTKYVSKSDGDWWSAGGPLFGSHVERDLVERVGVGRLLS